MPGEGKSVDRRKQKRQAEKIEEGYEKRVLREDESERRALATVNKMTGDDPLDPRHMRFINQENKNQ